MGQVMNIGFHVLLRAQRDTGGQAAQWHRDYAEVPIPNALMKTVDCLCALNAAMSGAQARPKPPKIAHGWG